VQDGHSNTQACRRENWFIVQQMTQDFESFLMEFVDLDRTSASGLLVLRRLFSTRTRTLKKQRQEKEGKFGNKTVMMNFCGDGEG